MNPRRHPTYRASSIPPREWIETRLGRAGTLIAGSGFPHKYQDSKDGEFAYYKVGNLAEETRKRNLGQSNHRISRSVARKLGARIVPPGAVVWAKIGAALSLNRRRTTSEPCCIDNNMTALVPRPGLTTTGWMYYWMLALDFRPYANPGAVPSISEGAQARLPILIPPLHEQCRIAAFLDYETARIDELVHEQERLQRLIEARRHSIIVQSVLKGLREKVPLRDSGFESLGHIPAHWTVKPTKYLGHLVTGTTPRRLADAEGVVEGFPWVRPDDFDEWTGAVTPRTFLPSLLASEVRPVPKGSLLVSCIGRIGTTVQAAAELATNQQITAIVPRNVYPRYLFYALRSLRQELERNAVGNVLPILNASRLSRIVVPCPPLEEQRQIAVFLDGEVERLNALFHHQEKSIVLLRERRSALISAAVTGQLDLRDWQPPESRSVAEVA